MDSLEEIRKEIKNLKEKVGMKFSIQLSDIEKRLKELENRGDSTGHSHYWDHDESNVNDYYPPIS